MGESLGSRPEELYAEHKNNAERLDEMQRRLDAARVLSDILTPEQIQQLGSADFDAKMQHENTLKEATQHYEENRDAYVEQAQKEMNESRIQLNQQRELYRLKRKAEAEEKMAEVEQQISDTRQWLIQDGTYSQADVDKISLSVKYNPVEEGGEVKGNLFLDRLTSAEGLILPKALLGYLDLRSLTSAKDLVLPQRVGRSLFLQGLTSAESLVLPKIIYERLDLSGLTTAEGLELPDIIGDNLYLLGLTTVKGLVLPRRVDGYVHLSSSLSTDDRQQLRAQRPDLRFWE
jgi:hypothetical protein